MNKVMAGSFGFLVALATSGCESLWNAANRGGLKKDVTELLSKGNISNVDLKCHMVGSTRTGICEGEIGLTAINALASSPHLTEVKRNGVQDFEYESWINEGKDIPKDHTTTRNFKSKRRPAELHLKNGGSFEYLLLFHNPQNKKTYIQVSYAYG